MKCIEVIPAELEFRLRALAGEAEKMLPIVESLAERARAAVADYDEALDPIFDRDEAEKHTSYGRLLEAILALEASLGAVFDYGRCRR